MSVVIEGPDLLERPFGRQGGAYVQMRDGTMRPVFKHIVQVISRAADHHAVTCADQPIWRWREYERAHELARGPLTRFFNSLPSDAAMQIDWDFIAESVRSLSCLAENPQ